MTTVKKAIIDLCVASGAQSLSDLTTEVKTQATYSEGADVEALVRQALDGLDFSFDSGSKTYQYRNFS